MTKAIAIFWPMIAQAALSLFLYALLFRRRVSAIRGGKAEASAFRVPLVEPEPSLTAVRSLTSQFELPVLFFIVCIAQYITGAAGTLAIIAAWLFVASRYAHAFIHVTSNKLRLRMRLFVLGFFTNIIQWLILAIHLLRA